MAHLVPGGRLCFLSEPVRQRSPVRYIRTGWCTVSMFPDEELLMVSGESPTDSGIGEIDADACELLIDFIVD